LLATLPTRQKQSPSSVATGLTLTERELEVLRLIREGQRNKRIADRLCIAESTVNFHIKNLMDKLQANHRTHPATIALRRGMLQI
jgi:DNA-binding NarL/FixJ family response regulator